MMLAGRIINSRVEALIGREIDRVGRLSGAFLTDALIWEALDERGTPGDLSL